MTAAAREESAAAGRNVYAVADETRFQRAIRDTPGLRENKRRRAVQYVVGAACAVVLVLIFGSPHDAFVAVLTYIGAAIGVVLLINGAEFFWRYMEAPYALVREELAALRADVHQLPSAIADERTSDESPAAAAEPAPNTEPWLGDMSRRGTVFMCIGRGEAILAQQTVAIGNASKWTEQTGAILAEKISDLAAEQFFSAGTGAEGARDRVERGLGVLRGLTSQLPTGQR